MKSTQSTRKISAGLFLTTMIIFCTIPFLSFNGCYYNPEDITTNSDTATFNVSGIITSKANNTPIRNLTVFLKDTVSPQHPSPTTSTDVSGKYSISWSYIKKDSLMLMIYDNDSTNGDFKNDSVMIPFSENDFKYQLTISKDVRLEQK